MHRAVMDLSINTVVFLTLSCCLWDADARIINFILTVPNGGPWGDWGFGQTCHTGHANAFSLKMQKSQGPGDDTAMNGIRLFCTNGEVIESISGPWGEWTEIQRCPKGNLKSFSLRVEKKLLAGDDTAANNIEFSCEDGSVLTGHGTEWGEFGPKSLPCPAGFICGIQTKVALDKETLDDTGLNDVKFSCCD
ncbi:vitelline membrane outer layer protein 1-like [Anolis sagrei]|uniref:vitelline membrane outer layer protein 1-like n=1 Tax=Anolis sagrei TaxID=38937 RepID=UPI0035226F7B